MYTEYEATFRDVDKDMMREKLQSAGAQLVKPEFMMRRVVFNLPDQTAMPERPRIEESDAGVVLVWNGIDMTVDSADNAMEFLDKIYEMNVSTQENKGWLRVRDEDDKITMSYKRVSGTNIEDTVELQLQIDNFEVGRQLLTYLGCAEKAYQETRREIWELGGTEVSIDEWPFLEPFVEVEGHSEADVRTVCAQLGFDFSLAHFGAVDTLYSEKYGVTEYQINNQTPEIKFSMDVNPFLK